ncbi:MAG: hypothetical protein MJ132_08025 [Clostridia bacterium]|nr:hypothetical protein [Clostridia bacterium]
MKKFIAMLLAVVMLFCLSLTAFAAVASPESGEGEGEGGNGNGNGEGTGENGTGDNGNTSPETGDFAVVYFGAVALATIPMALIAKKKIED